MIVWRLFLCASVMLVCSARAHAQDTSGAPAKEAAERESFEARLAEVDQKAGEVRSLTADFEQQKHTPLMKKPLVSSGHVAVKGDHVRWDTRTPRESVMTISGGEVRLYYPEQKVVEVYDLGEDVRRLTGSPIPRLAAMKESFEIKRIEPAALGAKPGQGGLLAIELTPKTEELRKHVASVRVLIDPAVACATLVETTDADGERTEVRFTNVKVNPKLDEKDVTLETPKGVRVEHPLEGRTETQDTKK